MPYCLPTDQVLTSGYPPNSAKSQKKVIAKFQALPDAMPIQIGMGTTNFQRTLLGDQSLAQVDEQQDRALIALEKDAKDDALIGELKLYAQKIASTARDQGTELEAGLSQTQQALNDGHLTTMVGKNQVVLDLAKPDASLLKMTMENTVKIMPFLIEIQKARQSVATACAGQLAKLLS